MQHSTSHQPLNGEAHFQIVPLQTCQVFQLLPTAPGQACKDDQSSAPTQHTIVQLCKLCKLVRKLCCLGQFPDERSAI